MSLKGITKTPCQWYEVTPIGVVLGTKSMPEYHLYHVHDASRGNDRRSEQRSQGGFSRQLRQAFLV